MPRAAPTDDTTEVALQAYHDIHPWQPDTQPSIWAETRWTAICASLKEDILEMFRDERKDHFDARVRYVNGCPTTRLSKCGSGS